MQPFLVAHPPPFAPRAIKLALLGQFQDFVKNDSKLL